MSETRDGQRYYDTGDKPITEHPDVQRLIKQAVLDGFKIKELQAKNEKLREMIEVAIRTAKTIRRGPNEDICLTIKDAQEAMRG